jgi:hypothetical protein
VGAPGCFAISSAPRGLAQAAGDGRGFSAAGATLTATGSTLWLMATAADTPVTATRVRLAGTGSVALGLEATRHTCDLAPARGPRWVKVATVGGGEPLVALGSAPLAEATFAGEREALAIDASGSAGAVHIWNGAAAAAEATVETRSFPAPSIETLTGAASRRPEPRQRNAIACHPAETAAFRSPPARAQALAAAGRRSCVRRARGGRELRHDADELLLVPVGASRRSAINCCRPSPRRFLR